MSSASSVRVVRLTIIAVTVVSTLTMCIIIGAGLTHTDVENGGDYLARAMNLQEQFPLIDGHNDLPWGVREAARYNLSAFSLLHRQPRLQTDIPRLRAGRVGAQFWSCWVPTSLSGSSAVKATSQQIDFVHKMAMTYPDDFMVATTASDVERAHKNGKIASLIGIEGGHSIDDSFAVLRGFFDRGARYMTLTHSQDTQWANSATGAQQHASGVTAFGLEVVREMNRMGMIVDLSHVSESVMKVVLENTRAPVMFSHSSARALCDHPRNVPDDVLHMVAKNGGVVMVNFYPPYLVNYVRLHASSAWERVGVSGAAMQIWHDSLAEHATIGSIADHMDHIASVCGHDCVGIGSDFDGVGYLPEGMRSVEDYPKLTEELLRRGWSDAQVAAALGGNILRVMRRVEAVAAESKTEAPASSWADAFQVSPSLVASITEAVDDSASPCEDFYQYACGGWLEKTTLASDKLAFSRSFGVIGDEVEVAVKQIIAGQATGSSLSQFYESCRDEAAIEALGTQPLQPILNIAADAGDVRGLFASVLPRLLKNGISALFRLSVTPDWQDPSAYVVALSQVSLSLRDRSYYLEAGKQSMLRKFEDHVTEMMTLLGSPTAARDAELVVAIETRLAQASLPSSEMQEPESMYNVQSRSELDSTGLPWSLLLQELNVPDATKLVVATPKFFVALASMFSESFSGTPAIEAIRSYLRWLVVHEYATALPRRFTNESFQFFGVEFQGLQTQKPRDLLCITSTNRALPWTVGREFAAAKFSPSARSSAEHIVNRVREAFVARLPKLSWLSAKTREGALLKLDGMAVKIGYPAEGHWPDESSLAPGATTYFANVHEATQLAVKRELNNLGHPVDRDLWYMPPQIVNAYFSPESNDINFPAAILQSPFFAEAHPAAMNFGALGMVVGHELTHSFDSQGRKFDEIGRLREWFSDQSAANFVRLADEVVQLYDGVSSNGGVVNGTLTLGENLADMGGIRLAWDAYRSWRDENGEPRLSDRWTNSQLFFLSFAQGWCTKRTEQYAQMLLAVDPHSPPKLRVNKPLQNLPEFADVFECQSGSKMRPNTTYGIW